MAINFTKVQEYIDTLKKIKDDLDKTITKANEIQNSLDKTIEELAVTKNATQGLVMASNLTDEEKNELLIMYEPFKAGEKVVKGDVRRSGNKLYEVIQDHTTQADWLPENTASLWKAYTPSTTTSGQEIVPDFKQPTGAHDAYAKGDRVLFNGKVYESLIANNAYSPSSYPAGWKEVK